MHKYFLPGVLFLFFAMCSGCREKKSRLSRVQLLTDYPSGSGIAYADNKIYLMGDDASYMLEMDTAFKQKDTFRFYISAEKRIAKDIKADMEAAAFIWENRKRKLLIIGSGSSSFRNSAIIIDPVSKERTTYRLDTFYDRLKAAGIKELNIEGAAGLPGGIVLSNRGNKSYAKNHLIFTDAEFWKDQANAGIHIAGIGVNRDTASFKGVSGLEYSAKGDKLLLTVSTENTYNSMQDGEIGKSYLWIVNDISAKKRYAGINISVEKDLEEIDARFRQQKIESVCILREEKNKMLLVLVSDDDKGGSVLFHLELNSGEDQ